MPHHFLVTPFAAFTACSSVLQGLTPAGCSGICLLSKHSRGPGHSELEASIHYKVRLSQKQTKKAKTKHKMKKNPTHSHKKVNMFM